MSSEREETVHVCQDAKFLYFLYPSSHGGIYVNILLLIATTIDEIGYNRIASG